MAFFTEKDKNGLRLLSKCIYQTLSFFPATLFTALILIFNFSLFAGALYFEYGYYGISMLNVTTLGAIWHANFWDHFSHFIFIIALMMVSCFITLQCRFSLVFAIGKHLEGKKYSPWRAFMQPFLMPYELVRLTLIKTIGHLENVAAWIDPQTTLSRTQDFIDGSLKESYNKYASPEGILIIPYIVEKRHSIVEALKDSGILLEAMFGKPYKQHFSFVKITHTIYLLILALSFIIIHFGLKLAVFPTLIISVIFTTTFDVISNNAKLFLYTALFNHGNNLPTGPFSKKEIEHLYGKPKEPNL